MQPLVKPLVRVEDRDAFLALASRRLSAGEAVVRAVDTYRESGAVTLQLPRDEDAIVVGREAPRLQPGGITEIVTYLLVRDTTVREVTLKGRGATRDVDVVLRPLAVAGRVLDRTRLHSSA